MGKRGPKPEGKVKIAWSSNFAYATGLIVTDGNLSSDGRHIALVSKDLEQLRNFRKALGIKNKIGKHGSGFKNSAPAYKVQFGDVLFYNFLLDLGITPKKSKTIGAVGIPREYFFDFLRGSFDGDGYTYSYWDKRWRSSFMLYIGLTSASIRHIEWLRDEIEQQLGIRGHITKGKIKICYQLKYAKADAQKIIKKLYENDDAVYLRRKKLKIDKALCIIDKGNKGNKGNREILLTKMHGCCN